MTTDVEEMARKIASCLSDAGAVYGRPALTSLLLATTSIILTFAKGDPNDLAQEWADELLHQVRISAVDFPEALKPGKLQ